MAKRHIAFPLGAIALAAAAPAIGVGPGSNVGGADTTIRITGFVPVICHARVSASFAAADAGVQNLGTLREFCNSPRGYRVHADYSDSLAHAKLLVDGKPVPLNKHGSVVVSRSNRAAISSRDLQLDLGNKAQAGNISFRIEPL